MLRGIYSHLNSVSKLFLLVTLVLFFLLLSSLFGILALVPFYGTGVLGLLASPDYSNSAVVNAMKVIQILNMAGGLLLPALVYFWLCAPGTVKCMVSNKYSSTVLILLSALVIVLAQPLIGWANELNSHLHLPAGISFLEDWMKRSERQGELITDAFLATTTTTGLLVNIFMIAILPAFAEEILFRGALASLFKGWTKNVHMAVVLSSIIFAAIHLQFYGFLPRLLLGMALGYLFFWSGSLWLPVAAHFTNNFLSVIIEFFYNKGIIHSNAENFGMDSAAWLTVLSIALVTGTLFYIKRITHQKG